MARDNLPLLSVLSDSCVTSASSYPVWQVTRRRTQPSTAKPACSIQQHADRKRLPISEHKNHAALHAFRNTTTVTVGSFGTQHIYSTPQCFLVYEKLMVRASHRTVTAPPKPKKVYNNLGRALIKKV